MKSFQQRNPVPIGIAGTLVLVAMLVLGYNTEDLPVIGAGTTYQANLANAAGLEAGDPVRTAGVTVGHVQTVLLAGEHVEVTFDVKDAWVGDESRVSIQLGTLLGQRFLEVASRGEQAQPAAEVIPLARTTTPYEIIPALNKLSGTVHDINVDKLTKALNTLSGTFKNTPKQVSEALTGLSRLSTTIAKRDDKISSLLEHAQDVSQTIAARDKQIAQLLHDINPLLEELRFRRDAIDKLLDGAQSLATQLHGLVADNRGDLKSALQHLENVTTMLVQNKQNIERTIELLNPYVHLFTNTVGSGRWFDAYVCGLLLPPVAGINQGGCYTE